MDDFGYLHHMSDDDDDDSHPPYSSDDDIAPMDEADLLLRALLSPMGMNVTRLQVLQTKETKGPVEKLTNLGSQFPLDIIQKIMTFVEGNWLARAVRVCKAWNARLNTEEIWKEKYTREFERSGESFRYYMCHWQFQAVTKDRVSKYLSYKRAYSVVFAAKIMGKCNYCNKHPGDYYGDGIWKVCKKCSDQKLISKDDVKRKYCLSEEEMKELIFFRMPPTIVSFNESSFLNEELDIYANKLFNNDVEGELKKRRKVFTTYDVGAIERFLSKRADFYNKLSQTLKNDTKYVPAANIPQIIQRFMYDPSVEEQSEEKVKKFVQHWDNLYHKYTAAQQAFEEAFEAAKLSPALRQEITIPIVDPINSNLQSYEHIRMENMLLGADDKRSFQNHATRLAREHQYKAAALIEMAKQTNNKFSTLDSLYTIAKRELEETCAFRRHLAGSDNNDIFNDNAKMSVHVAATVKRVLEFNAKEEALSNHLGNLGYNYKFMSMPKEVIDYVIGKSDLTFHQVVMKAIKDYTNPYADHNFIYNSMRFLSVQDKKTIACELYKKMLLPTREAAMNGSEQLKKQEADDEELDQEMNSSNKKQRTPGSKRREKRPASPAQQSAAASSSSSSAASTSNGNGAADPAIANLKIIKGRKRRLIVRNILHSLELGTLHKYILAVMNEKNNKEQAQASNHMMIE